MQLWEITEKRLRGIVGIQKSQSIFMLGSNMHRCALYAGWGKLEGQNKEETSGKQSLSEGLKGRDVLACPAGGSR